MTGNPVGSIGSFVRSLIQGKLNVRYLMIIMVPFLLFSPMLKLGNFGFSIAEVIMLCVGPVFLMLYKGTIQFPKIFILFIVLCVIGRLGAFMNSFNYQLPVNYSKLTFLFIIWVQIISYSLGRYSNISTTDLMQNRMVQVIIFLIAIYGILYLISDVDMRARLLRPFFQNAVDGGRFMSPRFPGLGINANIYSYCVLVIMVLSMKEFFEGRMNFMIPALCFIIILLITSKTTIVGALFALGFFAFYYLGRNYEGKSSTKRSLHVFIFLCIFTAFVIIGSIIFSDYITIFERFDALSSNTEQANALDDRYILWKMGLERVKLSPIWGIDVVQADLISDSNVLYFATPHNEFIFYWMSTGIIGALAYVIFFIYLIYINIKRKHNWHWVMIYFALIIQMIFDGAFQTLRFQFFFFIVLGINFKELYEAKRKLAVYEK